MGIDEKGKNAFAALLTLALDQDQSDQREARGECLSDAEFAALMDGRVAPDVRNKLLAHIDGCDACYKIWVNSECARPSGKNPWQRYAAGLGIAVSACLIFCLVQIWQSPDIHSLVDNGFRVVQGELSLEEALPTLPWELERTEYGFGPSPSDTIEKIAFGAGLWMGRDTISNPKTSKELPEFLLPSAGGGKPVWPETTSAPYYELGRWCSLVRAASISSAIFSEHFWKDQVLAFGEIREEITGGNQDKKNGVVTARLKAIGAGLEKATENNWNRTQRKKIVREINVLIDLLSPRRPVGDRG